MRNRVLSEEQMCRLLTYFLLELPKERSKVGFGLLEGSTGQLALWVNDDNIPDTNSMLKRN